MFVIETTLGTSTQRDAEWLARQAGIQVVGANSFGGTITLFCRTEPTLMQVSAWQAAVAANPIPADAPWNVDEDNHQRLGQALANLQQIIDAADINNGTLTTAQLSKALRDLQSQVKTEARILRRIIRRLRNDPGD